MGEAPPPLQLGNPSRSAMATISQVQQIMSKVYIVYIARIVCYTGGGGGGRADCGIERIVTTRLMSKYWNSLKLHPSSSYQSDPSFPKVLP